MRMAVALAEARSKPFFLMGSSARCNYHVCASSDHPQKRKNKFWRHLTVWLACEWLPRWSKPVQYLFSSWVLQHRIAILAFLSQKPQIWLILKAFGLRIFFWLFGFFYCCMKPLIRFLVAFPLLSAVARVSEAPPEISRGPPHTLLAYYYELQ